MEKKQRALMVHGYTLYEGDKVSVPLGHSYAVSKFVASIHEQYDRIFFLGGGPRYVTLQIDRAMLRMVQVSGDVRSPKLFLRDNLTGLVCSRRPRDTVEEVRLMQQVMALDDWRGLACDAVAIKAWVPRIRLIQAALGVDCERILEVDEHVPFLQGACEKVLRLLAPLDPLGDGVVTGLPHRFIRMMRT